MRIHPHHIHNVLHAYARRLSRAQAPAASREAPRTPASLEDKRRLVSGKTSMKVIEKMLLARQYPHLTLVRSDARPPGRAERFSYRRITPAGEETIAHLEMEDPGFLLRQMDADTRDE